METQDDIRKWLADRLAAAGHGAKKRLADFLGFDRPDAITRMLNTDPNKETRAIRADEYAKMREFFGGVSRTGQVPKVGYVGAGQAIVPFEADYTEWVEAPPEALPESVAVEVRGESMLPAYEDGYLLYYSRKLPPEEMVNKRCVVQLANGSMLVKTLRRGTSPGYWNLGSLNAYDIEDQVVEWAAPIDWIKPR